eukprot:Gregarina_sp_Poly_1__1293@NODE_1318_length_4396_cov_107_182721_g890_i0_p2_GENE_NODE_1318_length_4396_cov_107_182721_g890_i0NODE_1318_length_4396_cov_107_182721_g890_i0_p2_ORF_typecomplete_len188_score17_59_NODE_1318_length_4396_cov_107_182721_g890_i09171480
MFSLLVLVIYCCTALLGSNDPSPDPTTLPSIKSTEPPKSCSSFLTQQATENICETTAHPHSALTILHNNDISEKPVVPKISPGSFQKRTLIDCTSGRKRVWGVFSTSKNECFRACKTCRAELTEEAFTDCIQYQNTSDCHFEWQSVYETYSEGCLSRVNPELITVASSFSYFPKKYILHADQVWFQV